MSALDLPTELIAHIIIEAHNIGGVSALSSCALVCSTWNLISRPNILYKIKLTTITHLHDLGSLLDADPSVPPFVRVLVVQPLVEEPLVASPWIEQVPQILPSRLPNLHTIHLNDLCDFGEHINPQFITHFSTFSTVRKLAFDNAVIDFDRLISIAASLPALQVVDFGFMRPLGSSSPTCPRIRSPRLLSLGVHAGRIESKALEHVVGWLAPSYHSLRQLELSIYVGNTRTVGRLLRDIGKGLERLELRFEAMFPASVEAEVLKIDISLENCTALDSFTLRHSRGPVSRTVLEFIRELPSPRRLRRLGLGVLSIEPGEDLPDFTPLLHRLPDGLEELRILHSKAAETGAVLEKLRNDLPAAAAKGILSVSSVEQSILASGRS